jgi:dTDP-glucose 4,6-dehydratase
VSKYRYTFVKGDIADKAAADSATRDVDVVVNFAAETHVDNSIKDASEFIHSNVVGVHTLLESAKKYGKKFHQVSTDEVYGRLKIGSKERFTEKSAYAPRNPYSATKAAADHLVMAYFNTYKLETTISNCSNNFGPRQHREKLIPKSIINALHDVRIPVYGDGMQVRDWIYVNDHCSALETILKKGVPGETYLISADGERHNIDVVKRILDELEKPHSLIEHVTDRPGHDERYALDSAKIRKELGWKPEHGFEAELKDTIDWYRKKDSAG